MLHKIVFAILSLMLFAQPSYPADSFLTYSGSGTIAMGILYSGAIKAFEAKTGIHLELVYGKEGSTKAIERLCRGEISIAGTGRALTEGEKARGLASLTIAYDAIGIWVNRDNPVPSLSLAQLKGILTGKIRNWKEVGGKDALITTCIEDPASGRAVNNVLQELVMDQVPFGGNYRKVGTSRDGVVEASRDQSLLAPMSMGLRSTLDARLIKMVRTIPINGISPTPETIVKKTYPISRPLVLATCGQPTTAIRLFLDFILSPEGQAIVGRNFVPVRR